MRNDHQNAVKTESYRNAPTPDQSDFNFYMGGKTPTQIEEEVAELFVGFGYSIVCFAVLLVIGTIYQAAG